MRSRPRSARLCVFWRLVGLAHLCVGLYGCDRGARPSRVEYRDSADVRIIASTDSAWQGSSRWTIAPEPSLEIGVEEGAEAFRLSSVVGAVRLGNGRIVVADGGTRQIRIFDPAGRHLLTTGREGAGPGEYGGLDGLALAPGDTLVAVDGMQNRITLLDGSGRLSRVVAMPTTSGGTPLWYVGRFSSGSLLLKRPAMLTPVTRPGLQRDSLVYFRADAAGARVDSLARLPGSETLVVAQGAGSASYTRAFTLEPIALTHGDSVFFATGEDLRIDVLDLTGRRRRSIRADVPPPAVSGTDRARHRERTLVGAAPRVRPRLEAVLEAMPYPETFPALERLLADEQGNLWASEYRRPGATGPTRWTVIDASGRWLGSVAMPDRFQPTQIGGDFILGVIRDSSDVERVQLHGLRKPSRPQQGR